MRTTITCRFALPAALLAVVWLAGCGGGSGSDRAAGGSAAANHDHPPGTPADHDHPAGTPDDHDHPPGTPADHDHPAGHTHAEDTSPIPATLPAIWAEIESRRQELEGFVATGSLGQVHTPAFRIRALVAALPPLSGQYVSTRQGPLTDAVNRVAQIADLIHNAADSGDVEGVKNQKQRLDGVLEFVHGLYPEGVLATR